MKSFSCGEIVPDCPAVFAGRSYEDLLRQVAEHARETHGLLSVPPEVTAAVRAAVGVPGGAPAPGCAPAQGGRGGPVPHDPLG